jgi:hypothetical protein
VDQQPRSSVRDTAACSCHVNKGRSGHSFDRTQIMSADVFDSDCVEQKASASPLWAAKINAVEEKKAKEKRLKQIKVFLLARSESNTVLNLMRLPASYYARRLVALEEAKT